MDEPIVKAAAADSNGQSEVQSSVGGVPPATPSSSTQSNTLDLSAGSTSEPVDKLHVVKQNLSSARDSITRTYRNVSESTDDFVHESPWKAITIAALGGIVIGMLAAR